MSDTPPRHRPQTRPVRATGRTAAQPQAQQPPAPQQPDKTSRHERIRHYASRALIGFGVWLIAMSLLYVFFGRPTPETAQKATPTPLPTQVMPVIPATGGDVSFYVSTPMASPVALDSETESCSGADCSGADPVLTECALPEMGAYALPAEEVLDERGNSLGQFTLFGNGIGCGGVYWATFSPDASVMFEIQVINGEGDYVVATGVESQDETTSPMIESSGNRVYARIFVYGENGEEIARHDIRRLEQVGA